MKYLKPMLVGLLVLALTDPGYGQTWKALKKGQTVPSLDLVTYTDNRKEKINLQNLKGKLILLDFWGIHCVDCIAALPKMLKLQQQFKEQLAILVVTQDKKEQVEELWKKFANRASSKIWVDAGKNLPFVMEDTALFSLFPHKVLPTHVWINPDGTFKAITYNESTTAQTIERILKNEEVVLDEQKYKEMDLSKPLAWTTDEDDSDRTLAYSFFSGHLEYGEGGRSLSMELMDEEEKQIRGINCMNLSIIDLYKKAFKVPMGINGLFLNNRIVVEARDSGRFFPDFESSYAWAEKNTFCYALKLPYADSKKFYETMHTGLDQFFRLKSTIEKRTLPCWVLRERSIDKIKTNGGQATMEQKGDSLVLKNLELKNLFSSIKTAITSQEPEALFANETNYKGKISLSLPWKADTKNISITDLCTALAHFGLELKKEPYALDMLVIRDEK